MKEKGIYVLQFILILCLLVTPFYFLCRNTKNSIKIRQDNFMECVNTLLISPTDCNTLIEYGYSKEFIKNILGK